jgi:hypothetical protein
MFVKAIEIASKFTRPIHSISRNYGSNTIHPGAATLFFVNSDGWALTCGHVAKLLLAGGVIGQKAENFKKELSKKRIKPINFFYKYFLMKKYCYTKKTPFELRNRFMGCIEGNLNFKIITHPKYDVAYDVALIKFENYNRILCNKFPVFPNDTSSLQPGKMLCRLGFPFPEFKNFEYDTTNDTLKWTEKGQKNTPRFPIEGMVTRRVMDNERKVFAFEMSTPGLRGQSGGPVFDTEGKVWGMQCQTGHLDLNFDVDQEVMRGGIKKRVTDSAFLHVGICIHVDTLKSFMRENNVTFEEA